MRHSAFLWVIIISGLLGVCYLSDSIPKNTQAQIIEIEGSRRRIIGEEPTVVSPDTYKVRTRWVPRSLAVYLNGRRCQRDVEYTIDLLSREIVFNCGTTNKYSIIIDYEPE